MTDRVCWSRWVPLFALSLACVGGCHPGEEATLPGDLGIAAQPVVYGSDGRREWFEEEDLTFRSIAKYAAVALFPSSALRPAESGTWEVRAGTLGEMVGLCPGERFFDQPTGSQCSGVLVDHDIVMTAGHCVTSQSRCQGQRFVFGYGMPEDSGPLRLQDDDIYRCAELLTRRVRQFSPYQDFAFVRLDRPVVAPRRPVPVRLLPETLALGTPLVSVGFGSGLPVKVGRGGAVVRSGRLDSTFEASTDSFAGDSGGGIFAEDGVLVGILVAGQQDYAYDRTERCQRVRVVSASSGQGGEQVMYPQVAFEALCALPDPPARLCSAGTCGDGVCQVTETPASCPEDCPAWGAPPATWTCPTEAYADGGTCDCACGAPDPDCANRDLPVRGCSEGDVCAPSGLCVDPAMLPPTTWTCADEAYRDGEICDCGCGAIDPDCADPALPVAGCPPGIGCNAFGNCALPPGWRCDEALYADGQRCDCGCGAPDPDCDDGALPVFGCGFGERCNAAGACEVPMAPPPAEPDVRHDTSPPSPDATLDTVDEGPPASRSRSQGCAAASPASWPTPWGAATLILVLWALGRSRRRVGASATAGLALT